jgi:hypothetical protein
LPQNVPINCLVVPTEELKSGFVINKNRDLGERMKASHVFLSLVLSFEEFNLCKVVIDAFLVEYREYTLGISGNRIALDLKSHSKISDREIEVSSL